MRSVRRAAEGGVSYPSSSLYSSTTTTTSTTARTPAMRITRRGYSIVHVYPQVGRL
jgi:hypothetical protein